MSHAPELDGIWVPVPLPVLEDDGIDLNLIDEGLGDLADAGVAGVCACASGGDNGEYADLEHGEWTEVVDSIAETAEELELPLVLGVGHADLEQVLARVETGAELEPAMLLLPLPSELGPQQLAGFMEEVAQRSQDIALLVAEPPHSALLDPERIGVLRAAAPNLVGLVLGERGEDGYDPLRSFGEELALWCPDTELASGYRRGASGSISALACLSPETCVAWFEALERQLRDALAFERRWQRFVEDRLHPLRERHGASRAALDKALAVAGGNWPGTTRMCWPNPGVPSGAAQDLGAHAAQAGLLEAS